MRRYSTALMLVTSLLAGGIGVPPLAAQGPDAEVLRVVVNSHGWELVGDLHLPDGDGEVPAVLMLNQAAGDRTPYRELARHLSDRGIASLRLDLRGHGESTNLGRFVPGERPRDPMIWDAEQDVIAVIDYLSAHARVDGARIAVVGASYSGEEMADAGRLFGYAQAYVALSPGSFSTASILGIDSSGVPWLFGVSHDDRFLQEITAAVQSQSRTVELAVVPGTSHGTDLLLDNPDLAERIAVWLAHRLQ